MHIMLHFLKNLISIYWVHSGEKPCESSERVDKPLFDKSISPIPVVSDLSDIFHSDSAAEASSYRLPECLLSPRLSLSFCVLIMLLVSVVFVVNRGEAICLRYMQQNFLCEKLRDSPQVVSCFWKTFKLWSMLDDLYQQEPICHSHSSS